MNWMNYTDKCENILDKGIHRSRYMFDGLLIESLERVSGFDRALVDLLGLLDFLFMVVVTPLSSECTMVIYSGLIVTCK